MPVNNKHYILRKNLNNNQTSFDYSLRVSKRARHVRLAVKPYVGLEVVIPKRFPKKQIASILQQHQEWITTQLQKHAHSFSQGLLPEIVNLPYSGESFLINYISNPQLSIRAQDKNLTLHHQNHQQAINLLRQWLRKKAKQLLTAELAEIADEFGFDYKRSIIRSQKSRWGSCSSKGTISLNDQLLFMPRTTVRYLMIHELCHTRHLNHSSRFWQLVASCCPDYKQHEKLLNQGRQWVPEWFIRSLYC